METKCLRCKRGLKNAKSLEIGMGPVCARKSSEDLEKQGDLFLTDLDALMEKEDSCFTPQPFTDVVISRSNGIIRANVPHKIVYHSPAGFEIGYGGSGPADLALNILARHLPAREAIALHQDFKWTFIAGMDRQGGTISHSDIESWIAERRKAA